MYFAEEQEAFHLASDEESLGDFQEVLEINEQQKEYAVNCRELISKVGRNWLVSFSKWRCRKTRMREKVSLNPQVD